MRYEVDENLCIRIFSDLQEAPLIVQPEQPDSGQPWENREQAIAWAENYLLTSFPPKEEVTEEETPIVE